MFQRKAEFSVHTLSSFVLASSELRPLQGAGHTGRGFPGQVKAHPDADQAPPRPHTPAWPRRLTVARHQLHLSCGLMIVAVDDNPGMRRVAKSMSEQVVSPQHRAAAGLR
jgi:hypothetical protein